MTHGSLFSGIGGFDLAAEWMGWNNVFHCEWMLFPRQVLKYHFPKSLSYEDITKTDFTIHRGNIDILTGGFPCQPYSSAGKRLGKEDERHLWPHMLRAIQEIEPTYVVGENVRGLTNWNGGVVFEEVCADLESCGYEVQPILLPAAAVGAPHRRDRVWFIATDTENIRFQQCGISRQISNKKEISSNKRSEFRISIETTNNGFKPNWNNFPTQSPICGGDDGLPTELDGITFPKWRAESIKGYGNAIVPQVAYEIFKVIEKLNYDTISR
jgi:DNA (cytosine-5)-methyltransferase 1